MPRKDIDTQLRNRVDDFVSEITELVRSAAMQAVQEAIAGMNGSVGLATAPRTRKAATRRKATRKATRKASGRRSSEDLEKLQSALLSYIKSNPGQGIEEISRGMGTDSGELKRPVQLLLADKKLRTEGQRRGTRYFAGAGGRSTKKKASRKKATAKRKAGRRKKAGRSKTA